MYRGFLHSGLTRSLFVVDQVFSPLNVPGCQLALLGKRITGVSVGGAITTWPDASGQGNNATQSTASKKATLQQVTNGGRTFKVARFDGIDDSFTLGDVLDWEYTQAWTLYVISSQGTHGSWLSKLRSAANLYTGWALGITGGVAKSLQVLVDNQLGGANRYIQVEGATAVNDSTWRIQCATYDGSGLAAGVTLYLNGAVDTPTVLKDTLGGTSALHDDPLGLGANINEDQAHLTGDVAAAFAYTGVLSAATRQRIDRWCNREFGVTLA